MSRQEHLLQSKTALSSAVVLMENYAKMRFLILSKTNIFQPLLRTSQALAMTALSMTKGKEILLTKIVGVTASIHTQQTFQLHFIRRELVVGKTWVTKLQNASCNDTKQTTTLKMQVAREIKLHIVHTYVVVRSLPF